MYVDYSIYIKENWISVDFTKSLFNDWMLQVTLVTIFFTFRWSGEVMVKGQSNHDPNTHLSFDDMAVDDNNNQFVFKAL